ncbi:MAG: 2-C-methyl-D-erythritol 2,4-cyclodiphosphate synthase, partial [Desulfovibrionaceae bacterium]|nr:2-C-methyl-D-erythritol 2,4-cyclodiphosphate synthase [Desulfovibrionaceae bacterium]
PQGFKRGLLVRAHALAQEQGWEVTDDASLVERMGEPVLVVPGEEANVKITTPEDLARLNQARPAAPCVGLGYDAHRYGPGRPLVLGGIPIPNGPRVQAHSDGDVLLHALTDALLGCAGAGDIGLLFPDTDPAFEAMSSSIFVKEALARAQEAGLKIVHADLTVVAQTPKIAPWREQIAENVAGLLGLERGQVNVKATTEEGLGFTGEKKGLKAYALVTAVRERPAGDRA